MNFQIHFTDNREVDNTPDDRERVQHLILGISAILSEIIMKSRGIRIDYDSYYVEVEVPGLESKKYTFKIQVIQAVLHTWSNYFKGYNLDKDLLFRKSKFYVYEK